MFTVQDKRNIVNKALRGKELTKEELTVVNLSKEDGVALLDEELKGNLLSTKRPFKSMKSLVDVIPVQTPKGHYVVASEEADAELVALDGDNLIPNQGDKYKSVAWEVKRYGGITLVSSELYSDSAFDLFRVLEDHHGLKAVRTENKQIFDTIISKNTTPEVLADGKALEQSVNKDLNPALLKVIVTNQDGLELAKAFPGYKVFDTPEGPKRFIDVYPLEVFANEELPTTDGKVPFIYGDLKRSIKFFSRETIDVKVSEEQHFLNHRHSIRGIERFDVQLFSHDYQYKVMSLV